MIFTSEQSARQLGRAIQQDHPATRDLARALRERAEACLGLGPWSVTFHPSPAVSGDLHDYYSEGTYWWPDPANPGGPYIRRDGEHNPQRFTAHLHAVSELSTTVRDLSLAAYYLHAPQYARRASELIRVWFVAAATRMNPHLEYGQAIPGVCEGRGIGIIDTACFLGLVHGLDHLALSPGHDADALTGTRAWFGDYLRWLTDSKKGQDERRNGNNHSTYWAAQVGAFALLSGNPDLAAAMDDEYRDTLVPSQVQPDGRCPHEEARTRSLSYSFFNANALALLCEMAWQRGVDLWSFQTADGRGIAAVAAYLAPFAAHPERWRGAQITPVTPARQLFLQLGAVRLGRPDLARAIADLPAENDHFLGPMELLEGGIPLDS